MITKTTKRLSDFRHEDFEEFVYEITENNRFDLFNTDENSEIYKILTTMKKVLMIILAMINIQLI